MAKPTYVKSLYYNQFFKDLIKVQSSFELTETSYTKKIQGISNRKYIFNPEGTEDHNRISLIQKVRSDAANWMGKPFRDQHISYYDLIKLPNVEQFAYKIDLKSAYWETAIKLGIISEEANTLFMKKYKDEPFKIVKGARLAILGSLATRKTIKTYEQGKLKGEPEIREEATKGVYLHICKHVDDIMVKASHEIPGAFYYYWDCLFVSKGFENQAIQFFRSIDYDVGVTKTKVEIVTLFNDIPYLITKTDGKQYMIPPSDFDKVKELII